MSETVAATGLKQQALNLGFDLVGVADVGRPPHFDAYAKWLERGHHGEMEYLTRHLQLKEDPRQLLKGAQSVVAVALNYFQPDSWSPGQPKIAKYALGADYHRVLRKKLAALGKWVEHRHPESRTRACVDSAPIMERDFAQQAGLGFFGKNTMLIDPATGSWFFIGLLLTTVRFASDKPKEGGCGSCTKCVDACPTGAIEFADGHWQVAATRCISYLTIEHRGEIDATLARQIGDWTFGCDVCQDVCPFNQPRPSQPMRAPLSQVAAFRSKPTMPSLESMANLDDATWDEMTRGSAMRRAKREQFERNARINLENGQALRT